MSDRLPEGYITLAEAFDTPQNAVQHVIGVVSDAGFEPTRTRRNGKRVHPSMQVEYAVTKIEYMVTFSLADPEYLIKHGDDRGLRVRFFKLELAQLPSVKLGDIVLLRDVKVIMPFPSRLRQIPGPPSVVLTVASENDLCRQFDVDLLMGDFGGCFCRCVYPGPCVRRGLCWW